MTRTRRALVVSHTYMWQSTPTPKHPSGAIFMPGLDVRVHNRRVNRRDKGCALQ